MRAPGLSSLWKRGLRKGHGTLGWPHVTGVWLCAIPPGAALEWVPLLAPAASALLRAMGRRTEL